MKTNRMIAVAIFVMMAFTASVAFAASVSLEVVDNDDGTASVVAKGTDNVAGAAFTIKYDAAVTVTVTSGFFDTFAAQEFTTDDGLDAEGKVEGFDKALVTSDITGGKMIAAANAVAKDTSADGVTLFTLTATSDTDATYDISIEATGLTNSDAGYGNGPDGKEGTSDDGDPVPIDLLIGIDDDPDDPYPARLVVADVGTASVINGTVTVQSLVDSDADGMDDTWETTNFGDLTTSDGTGDTDLDGYTDLAEYTNKTEPLVLTEDATLTGYTERSDVREYNPDIDGDGAFAANDLILFRRWQAGWSDEDLVAGRTTFGADATRTTADEVKDYCTDLVKVIFDVDGDGVFAANDLILFRRWQAGWSDEDLVAGRTTFGADATRTTAGAVKTYLEKLKSFADGE